MEDSQPDLLRRQLRLGRREVRHRKVVHDDHVALLPRVVVGALHRMGCHVPFKGSANVPLSREEEAFNYFFSSTRMSIEMVFGMLKGRWGILRKCHTLGYQPKATTKIFVACCVLHNMCLDENDMLPRRHCLSHDQLQEYTQVSRQASLQQEQVMGRAQFRAMLESLEFARQQRECLMLDLLEQHFGDTVQDALNIEYD